MSRVRRHRRRRANYSLFTFTPAWRTEIWTYWNPHPEGLPRTCGTAWLGFRGRGPRVPFLLRLWLRLSLAVTRRAGRRLLWSFRMR